MSNQQQTEIGELLCYQTAVHNMMSIRLPEHSCMYEPVMQHIKLKSNRSFGELSVLKMIPVVLLPDKHLSLLSEEIWCPTSSQLTLSDFRMFHGHHGFHNFGQNQFHLHTVIVLSVVMKCVPTILVPIAEQAESPLIFS